MKIILAIILITSFLYSQNLMLEKTIYYHSDSIYNIIPNNSATYFLNDMGINVVEGSSHKLRKILKINIPLNHLTALNENEMILKMSDSIYVFDITDEFNPIFKKKYYLNIAAQSIIPFGPYYILKSNNPKLIKIESDSISVKDFQFSITNNMFFSYPRYIIVKSSYFEVYRMLGDTASYLEKIVEEGNPGYINSYYCHGKYLSYAVWDQPNINMPPRSSYFAQRDISTSNLNKTGTFDLKPKRLTILNASRDLIYGHFTYDYKVVTRYGNVLQEFNSTPGKILLSNFKYYQIEPNIIYSSGTVFNLKDISTSYLPLRNNYLLEKSTQLTVIKNSNTNNFIRIDSASFGNILENAEESFSALYQDTLSRYFLINNKLHRDWKLNFIYTGTFFKTYKDYLIIGKPTEYFIFNKSENNTFRLIHQSTEQFNIHQAVFIDSTLYIADRINGIRKLKVKGDSVAAIWARKVSNSNYDMNEFNRCILFHERDEIILIDINSPSAAAQLDKMPVSQFMGFERTKNSFFIKSYPKLTLDRIDVVDNKIIKLYSQHLPINSNTYSIAESGNKLILITDNYLYWYRDSLLTNIYELKNKKIEFSLAQNYPNPFNPSTKIKYAVSSNQKVVLKIFDILGIEITTLVNEEKAAGEYEIDFEASNLSSGIYFYQLRSGEFVKTNKMILMR